MFFPVLQQSGPEERISSVLANHESMVACDQDSVCGYASINAHGVLYCNVCRSFNKIAKTNLKAEFSITFILVGVNPKARLGIGYITVF